MIRNSRCAVYGQYNKWNHTSPHEAEVTVLLARLLLRHNNCSACGQPRLMHCVFEQCDQNGFFCGMRPGSASTHSYHLVDASVSRVPTVRQPDSLRIQLFRDTVDLSQAETDKAPEYCITGVEFVPLSRAYRIGARSKLLFAFHKLKNPAGSHLVCSNRLSRGTSKDQDYSWPNKRESC